MNTANIPARTSRTSESGLVWEEQLSGATGSIEVPRYATFRVRATGASTVTVDGVLAATMSAGEIMIFNAGFGDPTVPNSTVTVTIAVASAFVQVARSVEVSHTAV
jgi:hypothetical protein